MQADDEQDIDAINIVPLLDIMLVLLTIVLTTATFVVNGRIPLDLAQSNTTAAAQTQTAPLVLTMQANHNLYLNDQLITDLQSTLADKDRTTPVLLRADGKLSLQDFVSTVDTIKQQGFSKVSLEVQKP